MIQHSASDYTKHSRSKEREESFLQNIQDCGQKKCQGQKDEQFVCQFTSVIFCDEFSSQLDGPCHSLKLFIGFLNRSWRCGYKEKSIIIIIDGVVNVIAAITIIIGL